MRRHWPPPPAVIDGVAAAVLLVGAAIEFLGTEAGWQGLVLLLFAPVFTVALLWRRRAPLVTLVVVMVGVSLPPLVDPDGEWVVPFAAIVVALYSAAAYNSRRRALVGLGLVLAFFTAGSILDNLEEAGSRPIGDLLYMAVLNTCTWGLGRVVRRWREQARMLAERTAELEQEREWRAQAAVVEERARIARELHDIIAHSVSVMVVQAAAAEQMLSLAPERAAEPIVRIQETGRQAVLELRRLLGILRPDNEEPSVLRSVDEEASFTPQPTLQRLDALVEQARDAGLAVEVRVEGTPRQLTSGVELTAYRVLQEALTNTLKHAGSASVEVVVRYGDERLDLTVVDGGGGSGNGTGSGHGLVGMRERVALYGGELEAGVCDDGGFAVRARLPLTGTPA